MSNEVIRSTSATIAAINDVFVVFSLVTEKKLNLYKQIQENVHVYKYV